MPSSRDSGGIISRQCNRCGAPVQQGMTFCPNCGTPYPSAQNAPILPDSQVSRRTNTRPLVVNSTPSPPPKENLLTQGINHPATALAAIVVGSLEWVGFERFSGKQENARGCIHLLFVFIALFLVFGGLAVYIVVVAGVFGSPEERVAFISFLSIVGAWVASVRLALTIEERLFLTIIWHRLPSLITFVGGVVWILGVVGFIGAPAAIIGPGIVILGGVLDLGKLRLDYGKHKTFMATAIAFLVFGLWWAAVLWVHATRGPLASIPPLSGSWASIPPLSFSTLTVWVDMLELAYREEKKWPKKHK